jgi:hypothetical protein
MKRFPIPKEDNQTLTIDEMISFLISLKVNENISGDTEILIENDGSECTLCHAEIRENDDVTDLLFY